MNARRTDAAPAPEEARPLPWLAGDDEDPGHEPHIVRGLD